MSNGKKRGNILTIDFESWTYGDHPLLKDLTSEKRKQLDNNYLYDSTYRLLDILDDYNTKATFFIVAEGFDWYPECIKEIKDRGHEIGYHSHDHQNVLFREILLAQLNKSNKFLKKYKPAGFRAPEMKFDPQNIDLLKNHGFTYTSSIYSSVLKIEYKNGFLEFPVSVANIFGREAIISEGLLLKNMVTNIPIGSGFFFGLMRDRIRFFFNKPRHIFIHNWQVIKPENAFFPDLKFLLKHPFYWPYTVNLYKPFIQLLEKVKFEPISKYFELNHDNQG
ncbi:MAG: polysaccharide deacetylase family protein [Candidatus Hodarchaeota archaeon]